SQQLLIQWSAVVQCCLALQTNGGFMRKTSSWLVSLSSFLVFYASAVSLAITATADKPATWPQIKYEKYKLQNGLEVILSEDHRLPLVAVNLWYHLEPMYEKPGRTGFAHLFEHMMFQGSKNVGEKAHFKFPAEQVPIPLEVLTCPTNVESQSYDLTCSCGTP
ncbi:MAG TPA: insulinase family protein, partial [Terriglobales bacterium]